MLIYYPPNLRVLKRYVQSALRATDDPTKPGRHGLLSMLSPSLRPTAQKKKKNPVKIFLLFDRAPGQQELRMLQGNRPWCTWQTASLSNVKNSPGSHGDRAPTARQDPAGKAVAPHWAQLTAGVFEPRGAVTKVRTPFAETHATVRLPDYGTAQTQLPPALGKQHARATRVSATSAAEAAAQRPCSRS